MGRTTERRTMAKMGVLLTVMAAGVFIASSASLASAEGLAATQGIVHRVHVTLQEFVRDPNCKWLKQNLDRARGVLIFPRVSKGEFSFSASGGTGVFLARDEKTGEWSQA